MAGVRDPLEARAGNGGGDVCQHLGREQAVVLAAEQQGRDRPSGQGGGSVITSCSASRASAPGGFSAAELGVEEAALGIALEHVGGERRMRLIPAPARDPSAPPPRAIAPQRLDTFGVRMPAGVPERTRAATRVGVRARELQAGPAAHRLADEGGARDAGVVEHRRQIVGEVASPARIPARSASGRSRGGRR